MDPNLEQQVRLRAYELWLSEGMAHGRDWDHWYAAECELHIERAVVAMEAFQQNRKAKATTVKSKKAKRFS